MRILRLCGLLLCSSISLHAEAAPKRVFKFDGRTVTVAVETLSPPVEVSMKTAAKQPVVDTYIRYNTFMAAGDLDKAAELSASPEEMQKKMGAYKERMGDATFRAQMAGVFTAHLKLTHIVTSGNSTLLLGSHPQLGVFANFFTCIKNVCKLESAPTEGEFKDLAAIFAQLREKKITL